MIFSMQNSSIGVGEAYERMLFVMCAISLILSTVVAFLLLFNEVFLDPSPGIVNYWQGLCS
jgi:hypothetical protein